MFKKIVATSIIVLLAVFLFFYQRPIMDETEVVLLAIEILENPPSELKIDRFNIENIQDENIQIELVNRKDSFWDKLLNRQQWRVNINTENFGTSVYLDAYNGDFIDIQGQFS